MKREKEDLPSIVKDVDVILLDIEGTTTSISFVKDELFPYVSREVRGHLEDTWDTEETKRDVAALSQQVAEDVAAGLAGSEALPDEGGREAVVAALVANVKAMMDADRKVPPLKTLQGHMWRRAYHEGTVKGHVYEDVVGALEEWRALGKRLVIYSSGSVAAQKLLFAHSCRGDLLHFFSGHFDTAVGAKVESQSYRTIVTHLDCAPHRVLFLTDLAKEAYAAREAGLQVVVSIREGTLPLTPEDLAAFPTITSFTRLLQDSPGSPPRKAARSKGEEEEAEEEGVAENKEKHAEEKEAEKKGRQ